MTNASRPAPWPSPFRVQGLSSVKRWWLPLACELGMARRAKYVCSFTSTSAIPSTHKTLSSGPEKGKGQFTGSFWASSWTLSLRWFARGNPTPWRVRQRCVLGSHLEEPPEGYAASTDRVRRAARSEGPVAGGAEHLLLLHVSEIQMVPPGCYSQVSDRLPPGCSDFKEAMKG